MTYKSSPEIPSWHWTPYDNREGSQCGCCDAADAVNANNVWQCQRVSTHWWQMYPSEHCGWDTVRRFAHPISACQGGNCEFHPLMRPEYRLSMSDQNELAWEAESPERLAAIAASLSAERAENEIDAEAIKRERYARDVKERTMVGVRRGEAPRKLGLPCKWVIGEFKGDECWAWEYTDPKTGKRMCPHTCPRLHPGQADWHNEWFKNRHWQPAPPPPQLTAAQTRFGALVGMAPAPKPVQKKAVVTGKWGALAEESDEDASAW